MSAVQPRNIFTSVWEGIDSLYNEPTTWLVISIASCVLGVVTKVYQFALVAFLSFVKGAVLWGEQRGRDKFIANLRSDIQILDQVLTLTRSSYQVEHMTPGMDVDEFLRFARQQANLALSINSKVAGVVSIGVQIQHLEGYMKNIDESHRKGRSSLETIRQMKSQECARFLTGFLQDLEQTKGVCKNSLADYQ
jgi:hypothetical protein